MKNTILSHLPASHPWRGNLHYYASIDSTNLEAKRLAAQGAPHGTILIAEHQSGGRGRMGRSFHSPAGCGIYLSLLLRPQCQAEQLMHLTCATAVAMCDALEKSVGLRPGIKWTNDLVLGQRKLGGILTELGLTASGAVDYAIIGIGINCNHSLGDFPPELHPMVTSLALATGTVVDRAPIAAAMCGALYQMDQHLLDASYFLPRYRKSCMTLGKDISLLHADGSVDHGTALDVDETGGLVVRFLDGSVKTVSSGEVSVRGMYGYL